MECKTFLAEISVLGIVLNPSFLATMSVVVLVCLFDTLIKIMKIK
jgi:hypothetical protein